MSIRRWLMESDIDEIEATVKGLVDRVKLARVECEDANVRVLLAETLDDFAERTR